MSNGVKLVIANLAVHVSRKMTRAAIHVYKMDGRDIVNALEKKKSLKRVVGTMFTQPVRRLAVQVGMINGNNK